MRAITNFAKTSASSHTLRLIRPCFTLAIAAALSLSSTAQSGEADPKDAKPKGPEHNVTLAEEPGVLDLLNKAQKARERAEKDPQVWPECVKVYAEILRKYPNTVYLDKWEGPDKTEMAFKNGLYKSTRERVNCDIANLPPAGLAIYRVINDQTARSLFNEAQEQMDERRMEQVAQEYFPTSFGDGALSWLAEVSADRGAARQALVRLNQALKHPSPKISKMTLLVRMVLSQIALADRASAEKTIVEIETLLKEGDKSELRIGHSVGPVALDKLKARVSTLKNDAVGGAADKLASGRSWDTYFGNAAHNRSAPARRNIGLKKWSVPIHKLLYNADAPGGKVSTPEGTQVNDPTINQHLTIQDGYFYINDAQTVAAYPAGNPQPGQTSTGGNVKFLYPNELQPAKSTSSKEQIQIRRRFGRQVNSGIRHHPYFSTLANGRLFTVLGAEAMTMDPDMWRGQEIKQPGNYLVALGHQSGKLIWSLQPDVKGQAFETQSKADQEWLKSVFFVSTPTYESGVLYLSAIQSRGLNEAWLAAFDADNGKLLWKTLICSANPYHVAGVVQPDVGLPVAVANGTVFVTTNLGTVAAVDAMSGNIKWLRVYDRLQALDRFNNRGIRANADFWGPNPPVIYGNYVMTTPQDSDWLYAYDIETGRRMWEVSRVHREDGNESTGLKHVLGVVEGNLVVSGTNVHFFEIKSGKKTAGPLEGLDSPVKGRGTVTEGVVLVPTDRALFSIDAGLENGRFKAKIRDKYKWQDPDAEAGNVFVAGDVLYTTSHSFVNAYFVWEEMEIKLRDRIKQNPNELSAYSELADVYHKVDRFDQALAELDKGLALAAKDGEKNAAFLSELRKKKFDALYALGKHTEKGSGPIKSDPAAAYKHFGAALEVARLPGMAEVLPVEALRAMAENAASRGDLPGAVQHYQDILRRHGEAIYAYIPESSAKARLFAQSQIEDLKKKNPASYEKLEAEAQAEFTKAGTDTAKLEALLLNYPNSSACGKALLTLSNMALEKNPDQARQYALVCMSRYRGSDEAAAATALLATAYQKNNLLGPAKDLLQRMANRKEFADKTLSSDPAKGGAKIEPPANLAEWARSRLADPQFQRPATSATVALGDGKLKMSWSKPGHEQSTPLAVSGIIPADMRRNILFVENGTELSAIACEGRGDEIWTPRPKLPADLFPKANVNDQIRFINGRAQVAATPVPAQFAVWTGSLLVVSGAREIIAYDSREKGKIVWRKDIKMPSPLHRCSIQASYGRLVVGYPGGGINVLDSGTGESLWQTQVEGNQFMGLPALGDGFIGVAVLNPAKVVIFDLETGNRRSVIDIGSGNLSQPPVAIGDRLYYAEKNNLIQAVDGNTGKLVWQQDLTGGVTKLEATRELVVAVTDQRQITAMNTDGAGVRRKWTPVLPLGATVRELHIDGEDLYVAADVPNQKSKLIAYSIPKEGKIQWDADLSSDLGSSIALGDAAVAVGHIMATQSHWDATGEKAAAVVLIERKTGRLSWTENLASDQRQADPETGMMKASFKAHMFDGGIIITEGKKRTSYVAADAGSIEESVKALEKQLQQAPKDADLRGSLGLKQYEKGDLAQGLPNIAAALSDKQIGEDKFIGLYAAFARTRQEQAKKSKAGFTFSKVSDGSKLTIDPATWTGVTETVLDQWRDVYFPSDDETSGTIKKGAWNGADDLRVSFRGAYDDKDLHLLLIVSDDKHKNEPVDPTSFDLGDSVKVVFDSNRDGGMGYRGEMFAFGACVDNKNTVLSTRWVEHGKILAGSNPLQPAPVVQRDEAKKQTVYKFSLPLQYLAMKAEAGRKFGFSFVVNDQDDGAMVTKSIGASPGVLDPVYPSLFGEGILQEKK